VLGAPAETGKVIEYMHVGKKKMGSDSVETFDRNEIASTHSVKNVQG
jgi:hypothetical protein